MKYMLLLTLALAACGSANAAYPKATAISTQYVPEIGSPVVNVAAQDELNGQVASRVYDAYGRELARYGFTLVDLGCTEDGATLHFVCKGHYISPAPSRVTFPVTLVATCTRALVCTHRLVN